MVAPYIFLRHPHGHLHSLLVVLSVPRVRRCLGPLEMRIAPSFVDCLSAVLDQLVAAAVVALFDRLLLPLLVSASGFLLPRGRRWRVAG